MRLFRSAALAAVVACAPAFSLAQQTTVTTPSSTTHGSLVSGNIVQATGGGSVHNQLTDSGIAASNVPTLPGANIWTGLETFNGGIVLPGSAVAGTELYEDSNGNLHFVSPWLDVQLCGAKASGDATRCWYQTPFGSFIVEGSSGQQPNVTCTREEFFTGGSGGLEFCYNGTALLGKGVAQTISDAGGVTAGTTSFHVVANANIAAGQAVYGPGIPAGTTVSTYSSGAVTISGAGFAVAEPFGTEIAFINASSSTPQNSIAVNQCTAKSFTTQTGASATSNGCNGYAWKYAPSSVIIEGGNFQAIDKTGRESSVTGGGTVGMEINALGSGPDNALNRMIFDLIASEWAPSADGATTIGYGVRLRPSAAGRNSVDPVEILYGFDATTMVSVPGGGSGSYGSFQDAFLTDGGEQRGAYDFVSGVLAFTTTALASSGQAQMQFALGTNINPGQAVSGSVNIPLGTTVSSVYQCAASAPILAGCGAVTNATLVVLSANLTGNISEPSAITFTGVTPDGSYFSGVFSDAFVYWANQAATGKIKAGTTNNSGVALDILGIGNDSTATTGVDYGDVQIGITTNTHGAPVGYINLAPAGSGDVQIGGAASTGTGGMVRATSPALAGTPTAPTAAGGTNTTQIATTAFVATSFAPLASPALSGTPTAPTASAGTSTTQIASTAFVATNYAPLGSTFHPGYTANLYYTTPFSALTTAAVVANTLYAVPFFTPVTKTFTKISIDVTANAGTNCELGVYNNSSGQPGTLLLDAGHVSSASNAQQELTGASIALTPGWYWLAVGCDGAPTLESAGTTNGISSGLIGMAAGANPSMRESVAWSYSAGGLPSPFGAPTYAANSAQPLVYLRF